MNEEPDEMADPFARHISSLIVQLEELLAARPRHGPPAPEPAAAAAAPFAAPYDRIACPHPTSFPEGRAAQARELLRQRRMRADHLPAILFAEPAWDMLLDLYAARYEGKDVAVSSLCIAAAVPSTTALRWIEVLEKQGCIARRRDPRDGRRIFLMLGDPARVALDAYFDALGSAGR